MEYISSFFNYMRIEPLRIGPRIQKSDTNFRRALEQVLEFARTSERQERSGSVTEGDINSTFFFNLPCLTSVWPGDTSDSRNSGYCCC